ncbi:hypothetical protein V8F06_013670 [Rhypophila decipiens]
MAGLSFPQQTVEPSVDRIHVDELMALPTPDFVKYMRQNMGPAGEIVFTAVEGWDLLSKERREELRQKTLHAVEVLELEDSNASQIGPVDANQLTDLLKKAQEDQQEIRGDERDEDGESDRQSRETMSPEPTTVMQARWYNQLVADGGRPLYSLDQLDKIASNPALHHSLLRPWASNPDAPQPDDWEVFSKQLESWWDFRRWQRDNRNWDGFDEAAELAVYLEEHKKYFKIKGSGRTEDAGFERTLRSMWATDKKKRLTQRKREWETRGDQTFQGYVKAAKQRLGEHGFTQPFQLQQDSQLQDAWTTWVEYIEFNCWWLDRDMEMLERLQIRHDAEWKTVQEAGVLNDGETPESICTKEAGSALHMEIVRAAEGLDRTRKLFSGSKGGPDTTTSDESAPKPKSLQRAEEIYEQAKKRVGLLRDFRNKVEPYRMREERLPHRRALIPWLVEQASQIQQEEEERRRQQQQQEAEKGQLLGAATNGSSRKRSRQEHDEEEDQERPPKESGAKRTRRNKEMQSTQDQHNRIDSSPTAADRLPASGKADGQRMAATRPSTSRTRAKTAADPVQATASSSKILPPANSDQSAAGRTRNDWISRLRKRPSAPAPTPARNLRIQQQTSQHTRAQTARGEKTIASAGGTKNKSPATRKTRGARKQ